MCIGNVQSRPANGVYKYVQGMNWVPFPSQGQLRLLRQLCTRVASPSSLTIPVLFVSSYRWICMQVTEKGPALVPWLITALGDEETQAQVWKMLF